MSWIICVFFFLLTYICYAMPTNTRCKLYSIFCSYKKRSPTMCVCDVCALKAKQLTLTRCEVRRKNDRKDKREKKICVCVCSAGCRGICLARMDLFFLLKTRATHIKSGPIFMHTIRGLFTLLWQMTHTRVCWSMCCNDKCSLLQKVQHFISLIKEKNTHSFIALNGLR